ncbi:hypothetical protein Csa_023945, partial [Cucumis sativus]
GQDKQCPDIPKGCRTTLVVSTVRRPKRECHPDVGATQDRIKEALSSPTMPKWSQEPNFEGYDTQ